MSRILVDTKYTSLEEAILGTTAPLSVQETLVLVDVPYVSFDGLSRIGQLVVHKDLEFNVKEIFAALFEIRFPIASIVPIVALDWDDKRSMIANNTSGFNYRVIMKTDRLSNHSFGRAVDINPVQNPYRDRDYEIYPPGAVYDPSSPGTFVDGEKPVMLFKERGFEWGGDWTTPVDYQHFQKKAKVAN